VHPVALLSFFIPSVFMLFCLISLHYVNGINKVMMMMMIFIHFDREHERDGRTDGRTPRDGIGRAYA